ncbi:MAG: hypothetical protein HN727_16940, partial [Opitutae bacterium]|nr:hypothetical protein [Opitutae bacterium]
MSATIDRYRKLANEVKILDDSREGREAFVKFKCFREDLEKITTSLREVVEPWVCLRTKIDSPFDKRSISGKLKSIRTTRTKFDNDAKNVVSSRFDLAAYETVLSNSKKKLLDSWREKLEPATKEAKEKIDHYDLGILDGLDEDQFNLLKESYNE